MGKKDKSEKKKAAAVTAAAPSTELPRMDIELDALFSQAKQQPATTSAIQSSSKGKKRAVEEETQLLSNTAGSKKSKKAAKIDEVAAVAPVEDSTSEAGSDDEEELESEDSEAEDDKDDESLSISDFERELADQGLVRGSDGEDEELQDEEDEEEEGGDEEQDEEASSSSEEDADTKPPVHESLASTSRAQERIRRKLEQREEESKETRDKRSIFVGNVPIACVQSKTLTAALKKHIVALSPYPSITRVDALRYRSVAFSVPTADYAAQSGADAAANEKRRSRARAFKDALDGADGQAPGSKPYLNSKQKRKVAYINSDINEKAKSVNAYITLEKLSDKDLEKLKALPGSSQTKVEQLTGPVLAALVAANVDDTLFDGRHLRADLASPLTVPELVTSGLDRVLASSATSETLSRILSGGKSKEDQARTLFVGNLDFEADEEDLRAMLEAVMKQERGSPPATAGALGKEIASLPAFEETSEEAQAALGLSTWVQSVRMIRDAATQMGKGFAYVRFLDDACVDELMAIFEADEAFLAARKPGSRSKEDGMREDGSRKEFKRRLKLNKRPLRLARCKNTGAQPKRKARESNGGSDSKAAASGETSTPQKPGRNADNRRRSMGAPTPDGTSPAVTSRRANSNQRDGSPTRPPTLKSSKASSSSTSTLIPNPPPKFARSAEDEARLALKRNDAERQAKRMAKKERKKAELKLGASLGGDKGKVDLKVGKKSKVGKKDGFKAKPKKVASKNKPTRPAKPMVKK
jgi:nucleolar protein 12